MAVRPHPSWPGWYVLDIRRGKTARDRINFQGSYDEAQKEYWRLKGKDARIVTPSTCVGDLLGEFLTWYKLEKSPDTITDFLYAWKRLEPHFGRMRFHHVDVTAIDRYKAARLEDTYTRGLTRRPVSKRTITRELAYLSSFMKWAKEKGYTQHEVTIRGFPKKQTRAPIPVTHSFEEVQRIVDETKNSTRGYNADRHGLTLLMYDAGLRTKEARLITGERIDLPPQPIIFPDRPPYYGHITVIRKGGKEAMLPILTERLYLELKERTKTRKHGYLYINPRTLKPYKTINGGLKAAAERAGVTKKISHHLLRHDFVSHLHEEGADLKTIQTLATHADISTTMNIYAHLEHSKLPQLAGGFAARVSALSRKPEGGQETIVKPTESQ